MSRIVHTTILALVVAALLAPTALAERPDDRAGMLGVGAAALTQVTRPDDRPGARGPGAVPIAVAAEAKSDFDWGDAGVGAAVTFALALVAFGSAQAIGRERRRHVAT